MIFFVTAGTRFCQLRHGYHCHTNCNQTPETILKFNKQGHSHPHVHVYNTSFALATMMAEDPYVSRGGITQMASITSSSMTHIAKASKPVNHTHRYHSLERNNPVENHHLKFIHINTWHNLEQSKSKHPYWQPNESNRPMRIQPNSAKFVSKHVHNR